MSKLLKTGAAVVVGLALVAGQAMASATATPRIADRIGSQSEDEDGVPLTVLLIGGAVLAAVIIGGAGGDDADSD